MAANLTGNGASLRHRSPMSAGMGAILLSRATVAKAISRETTSHSNSTPTNPSPLHRSMVNKGSVVNPAAIEQSTLIAATLLRIVLRMTLRILGRSKTDIQLGRQNSKPTPTASAGQPNYFGTPSGYASAYFFAASIVRRFSLSKEWVIRRRSGRRIAGIVKSRTSQRLTSVPCPADSKE